MKGGVGLAGRLEVVHAHHGEAKAWNGPAPRPFFLDLPVGESHAHTRRRMTGPSPPTHVVGLRGRFVFPLSSSSCRAHIPAFMCCLSLPWACTHVYTRHRRLGPVAPRPVICVRCELHTATRAPFLFLPSFVFPPLPSLLPTPRPRARPPSIPPAPSGWCP